jgi:hypothetical protein
LANRSHDSQMTAKLSQYPLARGSPVVAVQLAEGRDPGSPPEPGLLPGLPQRSLAVA